MNITLKRGCIAVACMGSLMASDVAAMGVSFRNETCAVLHLKGTADGACFGPNACFLKLGAYESKFVPIQKGSAPKWTQLSVTGRCEDQGYSVVGTCAVDLSGTLRKKGSNSETRRNLDPSARQPPFDDILGAVDHGSTTAIVDVGTTRCEVVGDQEGVEICEPKCSVR